MCKKEKAAMSGNSKRLRKDSNYQAQTRRAYKAFYSKPKTMLMVSIETGILRANLCRYVAKWKKQNTIKIIGFGICPISKSRGVQFLTTNPDLFPAIVKPSNTVKL